MVRKFLITMSEEDFQKLSQTVAQTHGPFVIRKAIERAIPYSVLHFKVTEFRR